MTYTEEQFLEDVKAEAIALKQHATKKELNKLSIDYLRPRNYKSCIYGQMTGDCFSPRASSLIFNCCKRYFLSEVDGDYMGEESEEKLVFDKYVNGEKIEGVENEYHLHIDREVRIHYSSIETYIMQPNAKNANLIAFLRDETKELVL